MEEKEGKGRHCSSEIPDVWGVFFLDPWRFEEQDTLCTPDFGTIIGFVVKKTIILTN